VERDEAGRVLDERDAVDRDDEREEDDRSEVGRSEEERDEVERADEERALAERDDEVEREDDDREPDERSVVECERVPRRVDSCELTAHPPLFSSSDQICPMVIHLLQQHPHQPCRLWRQLQRQCLPEHSRL
jgi:hypothetical protein